jgi:hypothetical protein
MSSVFSMNLTDANVIYLDTEFTDLLAPELLSLGMVSAAGDEHYVELDVNSASSAKTFAQASDFVRHNGVLEQWGRVPGRTATYEQMGHTTARWLREHVARMGQSALIAFDYAPDYALLARLLRDAGQWDVVGPLVRPINVLQLSSRFDGSLGADAAYTAMRRRGLERHHALADAHALRAACIAVNTGKRVRL